VGLCSQFEPGVAAVSASNVWAVREEELASSDVHTLIEHWDGQRCRVVPSPSMMQFDTLAAVAAVSASNMWTVGNSNITQTLSEH